MALPFRGRGRAPGNDARRQRAFYNNVTAYYSCIRGNEQRTTNNEQNYKQMKIASLVSGGVDSSVTIPLLVEQGFRPHIFYIQIGKNNKPGFLDCPSEEDIEITSYIAHKYGLKMDIVDLHDTYWDTVIRYTIDTVKKGLTPNPDVMCNRLIKFGAFEEKMGHDFQYITTGHYARTTRLQGKKYLATTGDLIKDQTYFLSRITYPQLKKLWFPLETLEGKKEVRKFAERLRLPSAHRRDSQGICFLGKVNYRDFIRRHVGERAGEIRELDTGRALGTHQGYWFYTIGQRKGIGLSQGPWFVTAKDTDQNIIYVSRGYDPQAQYGNRVYLEDLHFITDAMGQMKERPPIDVAFKIRHGPQFHNGTFTFTSKGAVIEAHEKISGIAPGQFGALYSSDRALCLGSGVISEPEGNANNK